MNKARGLRHRNSKHKSPWLGLLWREKKSNKLGLDSYVKQDPQSDCECWIAVHRSTTPTPASEAAALQAAAYSPARWFDRSGYLRAFSPNFWLQNPKSLKHIRCCTKLQHYEEGQDTTNQQLTSDNKVMFQVEVWGGPPINNPVFFMDGGCSDQYDPSCVWKSLKPSHNNKTISIDHSVNL